MSKVVIHEHNGVSMIEYGTEGYYTFVVATPDSVETFPDNRDDAYSDAERRFFDLAIERAYNV